MEFKVERPLKWPEYQPRMRFQDRKPQPGWRLNYGEAVKRLEKELKRVKATSVLVTHNEPGSMDSGVAVWLSRKPIDEYGWQDALGLIGRIPSRQEIEHAYMDRVKKIHPDGPTPNLELFHELTRHRDAALRWMRGEQSAEHESAMGVDCFKEVRHNLNAIRMTLFALRMIERCGSPVMVEQAWRGFRPALVGSQEKKNESAVNA